MEKELEFIFNDSIDGLDLPQPSPPEIISDEEEEEQQEDFEFAFSIESDPLSLPDTTADQIFHNGQILPLYPLFNRDLITKSMDELITEYKTRENRSGSNSSSIASDPDRLSTSAPDRWRKSSSTGSSAPRKWKLRDLVGRSRSDSKERFAVVGFPDEREKEKKEKEKKGLKSFNSFVKSGSVDVEKREKKGKGESAREMDIVTAHRIYYGKSGANSGQAAAAGGYRRSFLPYRQELLGGIFGNAKHHHPFGN